MKLCVSSYSDENLTNVGVILQIVLISAGVVILGLILNRILGINLETARELRDKAFNLQERMRTAQVTGDPQEMLSLERE